MNKIILGLILLAGSLSVSNAYSIKFKTTPNRSGVYSIHIQCNNGSNKVIVYEPSDYNSYYVSSKGFKTINGAAGYACSKHTTLYRLKNKALVCKDREELRNLLSSSFSYGARKVNLKYGSKEGSCFLASSSSTVELLKKYSNESFPRPQDDGKRKWIENTKLDHDYYKVLSGGKIFYIGEQEIRF